MNPLGKLQILQFTSENIVRLDLLNVCVHIETEKNGHIPGHRHRMLTLLNGVSLN